MLNSPASTATALSFLTKSIQALYGSKAAIVAVEPVSRRAAVTCRVKLAGPQVPASVFVKHIFPEDFPAPDLAGQHVEFAEELLVQRFLSACTARQKFRPDLLFSHPHGIMILEDLGTRQHKQMRSFDFLIDRLSHSLALLHDASRGQEERYRQMRSELGIGEDRRRYGAPAQQRRFDMGLNAFLKSCKERAVDSSGAAPLLAVCPELLSTGDELRCLIHDDLGNARQTFEVGDDLFLLDFEYARYDCALIDLCKPLLGKFEINLENGIYLWNNPAFPVEFISCYRRHAAQISGLSLSDETWNKGVGAALIFHAFTLLGRLEHLEPDRRLLGSIQQNRNGILYRLAQILPQGYEKVTQTIMRYLGMAAR